MQCVRLADSDKRKTVRALGLSLPHSRAVRLFGELGHRRPLAPLYYPTTVHQLACDLRRLPAPFRPSTTVPSRSAQTPTPPALLFVSCATARHWSHCHRSRLRALKAGSGAPSLAGSTTCSLPPPCALVPAAPPRARPCIAAPCTSAQRSRAPGACAARWGSARGHGPSAHTQARAPPRSSIS